MSLKKGTILFSFILITGFFMGAAIGTYLFFGVVTLAGFVALCENVRFMKWLVQRSTGTVDVIIFILTILATMMLGVTIAASLTVAGLGYSLVYGPYVRKMFRKSKIK